MQSAETEKKSTMIHIQSKEIGIGIEIDLQYICIFPSLNLCASYRDYKENGCVIYTSVCDSGEIESCVETL